MNIFKFGFRFWFTILMGIIVVILFVTTKNANAMGYWCTDNPVYHTQSISEQSRTSYCTRVFGKNDSGARFSVKGDGMVSGLASRYNTREFGKVGQYKR